MGGGKSLVKYTINSNCYGATVQFGVHVVGVIPYKGVLEVEMKPGRYEVMITDWYKPDESGDQMIDNVRYETVESFEKISCDPLYMFLDITAGEFPTSRAVLSSGTAPLASFYRIETKYEKYTVIQNYFRYIAPSVKYVDVDNPSVSMNYTTETYQTRREERRQYGSPVQTMQSAVCSSVIVDLRSDICYMGKKIQRPGVFTINYNSDHVGQSAKTVYSYESCPEAIRSISAPATCYTSDPSLSFDVTASIGIR